jgi:hypothetical protein
MLVSTQKKHDNNNKIRRIQSSQGDGGAPAQQRERERENCLQQKLSCKITHTSHKTETQNEERRQKRTFFIHPIDEENKSVTSYTSSYLVATKCF